MRFIFLTISIVFTISSCNTKYKDQLFKSIEINDIKGVNIALNSGVDLTIHEDTWGHTPLMHAVSKCNIEIIKLLLEKGAKINGTGKFGETALMEYDCKCPITIPQLLISKGANVNRKGKDGETALYKAISDAVYGGRCNNVEINKYIKLLLSNGANANIKPPMKECSIGMASRNVEILKLLLSHGGDVNFKDKDGRTPIMGVLDSSPEPVFARNLINNGADVNAIDNQGNNVIMFASIIGYPEVVNYLLSQGANIKNINKQGQNALMLTLSIGYFEENKNKAKYLSPDKFKNIQECDDCEEYMLTSPQESYNKPYIVNYLLNHGLNINSIDNEGRTALMIASLSGQIDIIKILIDRGANINIRNNQGETALIESVIFGHEEVIKYLLLKGAAVNISDNKGWTAIKLAKKNNYINIVAFLKAKGAKL